MLDTVLMTSFELQHRSVGFTHWTQGAEEIGMRFRISHFNGFMIMKCQIAE